MKVRLKKQNRHEVESVNQTGIQAKSLTDIRPMDNALAAPQKPQTQEINHQQIQKKQGFNFAEIPISGNTDESAARIQPKFNLSLQKKLTVGAAGDKYEQEADSVAEKVVKQINTPSGEQSTSGQGVQRQEAEEEELQAKSDISNIQREGEEEEEIQAKSDISNIQREGEEEEEIQAKSDISNIQREGEEEEEIQAKSDISNIQREGEEEEIQAKPDISNIQREGEEEEIQAKSDISAIQREGEEEEIQAKPQNKSLGGGAVSTDIETTIQSAKSGGSPLDAGLQQKMGKAMGADFSGVKVHTDSQADKLNRSLSSRAFATGPNLFFKRGEYNPGSRSGQELIAHELTHVVQQGASKIQSKRESFSNVKISYQLQMKPVLVKEKTEARTQDDKKIKDNKPYEKGNIVEISDNNDDHKKNQKGKIEWYRIKDSIPPKYIRAEKVMDFEPSKEASEQEQEKGNDLKVSKDDLEAIQDLISVETWQLTKHGKTENKKTEKAQRLDMEKGFLEDKHIQAIKSLSQSENGQKYLKQYDFLTQQEVEEKAKDKKTAGDWHRQKKHRNYVGIVPLATGGHILSHIYRLQIATAQRDLGIADDQYKQTLGYLRYEAQQLKSGENKEQFKETIYGKDTEMWEKTLEGKPDNAKPEFQEQAQKYSEQTESAKNILQRIFIILHDGLKYRKDEKEPFEKDWPAQTAVALSHGGRVMVKLPPLADNTKDRNEFINWLLGNDSQEKDKRGSTLKPNQAKKENTEYHKAKVDTRIASTHDINIDNKGTFKELKGNNFSKGQSEEHYGMDIPLGGLGQEDIAGGVILPDGSHGHMYIFYEPPTLDKPGGLLIGAETSRMAHADIYGQYHDATGTSSEFSSTGTSKEGRIGAEIGGRIVDYTKDGKGKEVADPNWLQQLQQAEQNVQAGLITSKELVGKASKEVEQKLFGDRPSKRPEEQPLSTENANNSASSEIKDESMNQEIQNDVNTEQKEEDQ
ncbi:hypothetical protein NIES204_01150 [Planktothrix agardhii NIES-204]|nr:hypothetical protein NIES204_01150 [Planktothrix agardhii NIES-204]